MKFPCKEFQLYKLSEPYWMYIISGHYVPSILKCTFCEVKFKRIKILSNCLHGLRHSPSCRSHRIQLNFHIHLYGDNSNKLGSFANGHNCWCILKRSSFKVAIDKWVIQNETWATNFPTFLLSTVERSYRKWPSDIWKKFANFTSDNIS